MKLSERGNSCWPCDTALGCFLLQRTALYENAEVVRSRDPEVLAALDIVIDVGAVYDPENNRFDHHQRGFEEEEPRACKTMLAR
jgi:uncharacterized UPF0160 family protein